MRHLLSLLDLTRDDLADLFERAREFEGGHGSPVRGAAALFFPEASLRTRVSFERGAYEMGLQPIVFPPESLDKSEDLGDVARYLASWVDLLVIRHRNMGVLRSLADADALPVINAMTEENHPCEVLSDLYGLARRRDPFGLRFLVVAPDGNIARGWGEAATAFGIEVVQSCPTDLRAPGMAWNGDLRDAVRAADVIITDGPGPHAGALAAYRVTAELLDSAPSGVEFAPCPPFVRGREVSADAIDHPSFVGHRFKRHLKTVQQAVMSFALDQPSDSAGVR